MLLAFLNGLFPHDDTLEIRILIPDHIIELFFVEAAAITPSWLHRLKAKGRAYRKKGIGYGFPAWRKSCFGWSTSSSRVSNIQYTPYRRIM